jgi:hypothetical protein
MRQMLSQLSVGSHVLQQSAVEPSDLNTHMRPWPSLGGVENYPQHSVQPQANESLNFGLWDFEGDFGSGQEWAFSFPGVGLAANWPAQSGG